MLPADLLDALDGLSPEEALRRPVDTRASAADRIAALLGGEEGMPEPLTVGDMLFRWARTEPTSLDEADIPEVRTVSAILAATGRLPRRLGMLTDLQLMAKGYLMSRLADVSVDRLVLVDVAEHLLQSIEAVRRLMHPA